MIDFLWVLFSEFLVTALVVLSPSRVVRNIVCKTPLNEPPNNITKKVVFFVVDCVIWICVAVIAAVLGGVV